jgi:hypothetical protein
MHHQIRGRLPQVTIEMIVNAMLVITAGMDMAVCPIRSIQLQHSMSIMQTIKLQLPIVTLGLRDRMKAHVQAVALEHTKVRLAMRDAPRVLQVQVHLLVVP